MKVAVLVNKFGNINNDNDYRSRRLTL
ncbi:hypothetical protein [Microcoleus sp. FACHB-1515]|nr:hypothetical protein [Microcoleus sp. FACHB-1515]